MENVIEIKHLSKRFGKVQAADDLSFKVKEGVLFEIYFSMSILLKRKAKY